MGNFFPTHQLVFDAFSFVYRDRKTNPHRVRTNGGVDANNFTLVIQGTTGITGVDRGIGLNKIDTLVRNANSLLGRLRVLIIPKVTVLSNPRVANCDRPVSTCTSLSAQGPPNRRQH